MRRVGRSCPWPPACEAAARLHKQRGRGLALPGEIPRKAEASTGEIAVMAIWQNPFTVGNSSVLSPLRIWPAGLPPAKLKTHTVRKAAGMQPGGAAIEWKLSGIPLHTGATNQQTPTVGKAIPAFLTQTVVLASMPESTRLCCTSFSTASMEVAGCQPADANSMPRPGCFRIEVFYTSTTVLLATLAGSAQGLQTRPPKVTGPSMGRLPDTIRKPRTQVE